MPGKCVSCSRRDFCERLVKLAFAAGFVMAGFDSCSDKTAALLYLRDHSLQSGQKILLDATLAAYQPLASVGGSAYTDDQLIIVYRASETQVNAFSSICTHQGCALPLPSNQVITCSCHGSQFDTSGQVASGPATTNLATYTATISGNIITITI